MANQLISPEHISFVIQGLATNATRLAIANIREIFPGAEIIVSTWVGCDTNDLDCDKLIENQDPGFFRDSRNRTNNINRQLVSTLNGIKLATREYVVKTRSDIYFIDNRFTVIGEHHPDFFNSPITITNIFCRNPAIIPLLFHPSDVVQFGKVKDLLDFWDSPTFKYGDLYYPSPKNTSVFGNFMGFTNLKMVPEQALTLAWASRHGIALDLSSPCQTSPKLIRYSERILGNNFLLIDYRESGIIFPNRFLNAGFSLRSVYSPALFSRLEYIHTNKVHSCSRTLIIWFNQYISSLFRPGWWMSSAIILIFRFSPSLGHKLRAAWRRIHALKD